MNRRGAQPSGVWFDETHVWDARDAAKLADIQAALDDRVRRIAEWSSAPMRDVTAPKPDPIPYRDIRPGRIMQLPREDIIMGNFSDLAPARACAFGAIGCNCVTAAEARPSTPRYKFAIVRLGASIQRPAVLDTQTDKIAFYAEADNARDAVKALNTGGTAAYPPHTWDEDYTLVSVEDVVVGYPEAVQVGAEVRLTHRSRPAEVVRFIVGALVRKSGETVAVRPAADGYRYDAADYAVEVLRPALPTEAGLYVRASTVNPHAAGAAMFRLAGGQWQSIVVGNPLAQWRTRTAEWVRLNVGAEGLAKLEVAK